MTKQVSTYLGADDQSNYEDVVKDQKGLSTSTLTHEIVQLMTPGVIAYVGAYIIVDGPIVAHSSGPAPVWRKYIYVDADWNERVFSDIGALFDYIATQFPSGILRKHRYTRTKANTFELIDVSTFDVGRWAERHGSE